ncbi:MAG: hypothetical protein H6865_04045 [Rhodospirillales bacterium]|nr:hypothetical protein [Alphaproteobacteria bacterium]MCB9986789.1 hypothetical protein [Rhodospirillales bacterium]USO08443.1 MAG: hypothetical protein H6866_04330 [Rhodospirillales bacterium]
MRVPDYSSIPIQECDEPMVDLAQYPIALEPMAFRKGYTANPQLWARVSVAAKLEQIQHDVLDAQGLRLKVFDAWRPRAVQDRLYAACWKTLAEQDPERTKEENEALADLRVVQGSDEGLIPPHTTGGALDVTLIDTHENAELGMGSPYLGWDPGQGMDYDHRNQPHLRTLTIAMTQAGFVQDPYQWWHFDYGNQKWARVTGAGVAIYGEIAPAMGGFMKKGAAFGHGMLLPYELR